MSVLTSHDRSREYLTVAEVADELRCSEPTIRRRIREGSLPAYHLGSAGTAIRVPRTELIAWLRQSGEPSAWASRSCSPRGPAHR